MPRDKGGMLQVWHVSGRDRAIYEQVEVFGRTQRDVAAEYKISQPRVSNIIKRVGAWMAEIVPTGLDEMYRGRRLYTACRTHRMRLSALYKESMNAWQKSTKNVHSVKRRRNAQGEMVAEDVVTERCGDPRFLTHAGKFAGMIIDFEGIKPTGEVDPSCDGRLYEEPERTYNEAWDLVKQRAKAEVLREMAEQRRNGDPQAAYDAAYVAAYDDEEGHWMDDEPIFCEEDEIRLEKKRRDARRQATGYGVNHSPTSEEGVIDNSQVLYKNPANLAEDMTSTSVTDFQSAANTLSKPERVIEYPSIVYRPEYPPSRRPDEPERPESTGKYAFEPFNFDHLPEDQRPKVRNGLTVTDPDIRRLPSLIREP